MSDYNEVSSVDDRFGFARRFLVCSDIELVDAFNKEVGREGRMNDRVDFLYHLQRELLFRKFDISAIITGRTLSMQHRVRLVENRLVV